MKKPKILETLCAVGLVFIVASVVLEMPKFFFYGIFLFPTCATLLVFRFFKKKAKISSLLRSLKKIPIDAIADFQATSTNFVDQGEQFLFISKYYEMVLSVVGFNLAAINLGMPASKLLLIPVDAIPQMLSFHENGKKVVMLFGLMQVKDNIESATTADNVWDFLPEITDKILGLHSAINFINAYIQYNDKKQSSEQIVKSLQSCLFSSIFLQETFVFFRQKAVAIKADNKAAFDKDILENLVNAFLNRTRKQIDSVIGYCIDMDDANKSIHSLKFKNYDWMTQQTDDILSLNGYPLPADVVRRKSIEAIQSRA